MMKISRYLLLLLVLFSLSSNVGGQALKEGKNTLVIRGQSQDIYYFPAVGDSIKMNSKVMFAGGDGGWRGFTITLAEKISSWGFDVYGLDTKRYLESFTGKTKLKESEVMTDFRQMAEHIRKNVSEKINLFGWSEGAGLCLLAAASMNNKNIFTGMITMGLPDSNVLGWKLIDYITYLTKKNADEPTFESIKYLPDVTPLPLFMIQSTHDEYVSLNKAEQLFMAAREPKRLSIIEARNHHFEGNQEKFFNTLHEGLLWISATVR